MATSSFDRNVSINKKNYESLENIVSKQYDVKKSFFGIKKIESLDVEEIKKRFNK